MTTNGCDSAESTYEDEDLDEVWTTTNIKALIKDFFKLEFQIQQLILVELLLKSAGTAKSVVSYLAFFLDECMLMCCTVLYCTLLTVVLSLNTIQA